MNSSSVFPPNTYLSYFNHKPNPNQYSFCNQVTTVNYFASRNVHKYHKVLSGVEWSGQCNTSSPVRRLYASTRTPQHHHNRQVTRPTDTYCTYLKVFTSNYTERSVISTCITDSSTYLFMWTETTPLSHNVASRSSIFTVCVNQVRSLLL